MASLIQQWNKCKQVESRQIKLENIAFLCIDTKTGERHFRNVTVKIVQSRNKRHSTKTKARGATTVMTDGFCPQIHLGSIDPSDGPTVGTPGSRKFHFYCSLTQL